MNLCFWKARFKLAIRNLTITVSVVDFQSVHFVPDCFPFYSSVPLFCIIIDSSCFVSMWFEYTHVTKENLYNKMYTLNSVFFSVSITFSSIHPLLFKETSSLSNYELPCTKEKDGKIRTFSLWTRDYFTCFDSGPPNSDG